MWQFCLPRDLYHYLETFWFSQLRKCYGHSIDRGQDCGYTSHNAQEAPQTKKYSIQNVLALRSGSLVNKEQA